jgi:HK97 family phage major capsid protein
MFGPISCSGPLRLAVDEAAEWTTTGVTTALVGAGVTVTETKPVMKQVTIQMAKAISLVHVSEELDADDPSFAGYIWKRLGQKIKGAVENSVIRGTGVNEPLGVLNSPSAIVVAAGGATLTAGNVSAMMARLLPGGYGSAFWIAHPTELAGIGALGIGIYNPNGPGGSHGTILGRPLYVSEYANVAASQGSLALVDPQGYAWGVMAPRNQTSIDFMFLQYLKSFRAVFRYGGAPLLSAVVQPRTGTNTLSHTVLMGVRA